MARDTSHPNIVVVGGGVIGVSIATHLQREGGSVILLTEAGLASGASGRSLSWLNSAGIRSEPYHALRMAGIDRYRTLYAQDPGRDWLRFDGGVYWAAPGKRATTEHRHAHERAHAYDSTLVDKSSVADVAPGVDPQAIDELGIHNPGEGWVSLPHLIDHLVAEFTANGGEVRTNAGRARVRSAGRVSGVETDAGLSFAADRVVVACGAATPAMIADLGVTIPDGSPLSMLVVTEPVDSQLRTVLNTPRVAVRPEPGGRFALDHSWYESEIVEHPDGTCVVDDSVVKELVAEAGRVLCSSESLTARGWKLGRKPIPGDGEPVFGELEQVPGCYVAFTHSGATLALIAGELAAHEVLTGERHPMLATFRPERFADQGDLTQDQA